MNRSILSAAAAALAAAGAFAFDAQSGLEAARSAQFRQRTDRVLPAAVTREAKGVVANSGALLRLDGEAATLTHRRRVGRPWLVLDIGEAGASGYAVIHVKGFRGTGCQPVIRLSYACFPDVAAKSEFGDFSERDRSTYMTRDVELPVPPANVFRHELYTVSRTGAIIAPMHQPQFRYVRVALDSPDTEVDIDAIEWVIGDGYDRQDLAGYFRSSDAALDLSWQIGVWTAQFATIRDVAGWRAVDGWLLPRKLEKGPDVGLCNAARMPEKGSLNFVFETRHNPARIAAAGFALFAADPENALLLSLEESGVARWTRRVNGRDDIVHESVLAELWMRDTAPYRLEIRWRPMKAELFLSKGVDIDIVFNGRRLETFHYYHGAQGDRFGFFTPKNVWPMFDFVELKGVGGDRAHSNVPAADGEKLFRDDFSDAKLAAWDFPRPRPVVSDGAKRDRLVWSGDLWWAGRNFYYSLGDLYGMRDSILLLAHAQTPEGFIHACPYPEIPKPKSGEYGMFESDEFAAWFVPVLYDYYLYTADRATLDAVWPALVKLMDYLDSFTGADGLFQQRFETSKSAFSAGLQRGNTAHRSYMDILLFECRRNAALLAAEKGDGARAAKWRAAAERTKKAVFAAYWDAGKGAFRAQIENVSWRWDNSALKAVRVDGKQPWAMEANSLALATHIVDAGQAKTVAATVHDNKWTIKYVVMAARGKAEYGMGDEAWAMISTNNWRVYTDRKKPWKGPMTTPEGMCLWEEGPGDQSHPDTALAGFISTAFLGVVPTSPGFRTFKFEPHPYAELKFAEGRVPTPHGAIDARWERTAEGGFSVELTVPEGTKADVVFPGAAKPAATRGIPAGRHTFVFSGR